MEYKTSPGSTEHQEFSGFVLSVFKKDKNSVVALIGNNTNTNEAFSRNIWRLFVSSRCHRYNLAVKDVIADHNVVISKVKRLMETLSFSIPVTLLRQKTAVATKCATITRWSSTHLTLKHHFQLKKFIEDIGRENVREHLLGGKDSDDVKSLLSRLEGLDSTTRESQNSATALQYARVVFGGLIERHPRFGGSLSSASDVVKNENFQSYFQDSMQTWEAFSLCWI